MDLSWSNDSNKNIEFPVNYWQYVLSTYNQFAQGEHSVTKAYTDYLGFTDDYDFCWGPENEGEPLKNRRHEYDKNDEKIIYYPEYTERLWGIYQQSAGEIYLVKANKDLTAWERNEQVMFVPSGSRKPTIAFNQDGRYIIMAEFIPADSETYEIWIMEPPYENDGIRKICDGTEPQLFVNHDGDLILFYTDNEQYNIHYRLYSEDWAYEYTIDEIYTPERQLHLLKAYKVFEPYSDDINKALDYKGKNILFYKRDDDYKPIKYIMTDVIKEYPPYIEKNLEENIAPKVSLSGIEWFNIIAGIINTEEDMQPDISLSTIEWVEIITQTLQANESISADISLETIDWVEIIILTYNPATEDITPSISLETILWVEA